MKGRRIYTVGEINAYIHGIFEDDLVLSGIRLKGELSNVKYHSSGHIYFTLKDESARIAGVMFSSDASSLSFRLREGQSVLVTGRVSVYERDGKYQIYAREIERDGTGLLYEQFEKLKKKLEEMGMFDEMYKQPIPRYIRTLGIVTAPTGAAVRDMIQVSLRRNPYLQILLYPAQVQGEGAARSIVSGIRAMEAYAPDIIIVGRGGGSIEDLWAFNEEIVAQAIFDCPIPIITGIGHETDTTIADFVSDRRASTPSAAAELAVFDYALFSEQCEDFRQRLIYGMNRRLRRERQRVREYTFRLSGLSPGNRLKIQKLKLRSLGDSLASAMENRIADGKMRILDLENGLENGMRLRLDETRRREQLLAEKLDALSPLKTLSRGYTFTETMEGKPLKDVREVQPGDFLRIYLRNGKVKAHVTETEERDDH